jgi:hypothetical protein
MNGPTTPVTAIAVAIPNAANAFITTAVVRGGRSAASASARSDGRSSSSSHAFEGGAAGGRFRFEGRVLETGKRGDGDGVVAVKVEGGEEEGREGRLGVEGSVEGRDGAGLGKLSIEGTVFGRRAATMELFQLELATGFGWVEGGNFGERMEGMRRRPGRGPPASLASSRRAAFFASRAWTATWRA